MDRSTAVWLARGGYAARGLVFMVIGGLAVAAAIGWRRSPVGATGAISALSSQPFGLLLIAAIAVGLYLFAAWRLLQSVFDVDAYGDDARGMARRAGFAASALINVTLASWAAYFVASTPHAGERSAVDLDWTAWLMGLPLGRWILAAVGVGIGLAGIASAVRGWRAEFKPRLEAAGRWRRWIIAAGRAGFFARAFVFLTLAGIVVAVAWRTGSQQEIGLSGALRALAEQPYGWILLGLTALGILAFGVFEIFQAAFHRVDAGE